MSACLSDETIERYLFCKVESSDELRTIDAHLTRCEKCRDALRTAITSKSLRLQNNDEFNGRTLACLDDDLIVRFVNGECDVTDAAVVTTHVENCSRCADIVAHLRAFRVKFLSLDWKGIDNAPGPTSPASLSPESNGSRALLPSEPKAPRSPVRIWLFLPGVVAVTLACIWLITARVIPRAPVDSLRDGNLTVRVSSSRLQTEGTGSTKQLLDEKLGPNGVPQLLSVGRSPMRIPRESMIVLRRPFPDEVLLDSVVEIRWDPLETGENYRVTVDRVDIPRQTRVETTQAISITVDLERGHNYVVGVRALSKDAVSLNHVFRIVDEAESRELNRDISLHSASHLLRGIVFEKRWMFTRALAEYRIVRDRNPGSKTARRIYDELLKALTYARRD